MATASYTPGTWLGVIRSGTAVLLGPGSSPELAQSLWELLGTTPEVHEVLHAVTSGFGVSLAQIPSFGIVDFHASLRVFLRGDLDLTVQLASGSMELNGRDVTTWTERRLAAPKAYVLTVAGDARPGTVLPLGEGVVLLQSLTVALAGPAAEAAASDPATAAAVPEPAVAGPTVAGPAVAGPAVTAAVVGETETASGLYETYSEAGAEPGVEHESGPVLASEPGPAAGPGGSRTEDRDREVSAETVMGVLDEDHDATDSPDSLDNAGKPENPEGPEPSQPEAPASFAGQVPAHELTGSYDHLWEKTVVRRIEDAAVRDEPEEEDPAYAAMPAAENQQAENQSPENQPAENQSAQNAQAEPQASGSGSGAADESAASGSEPGGPAAAQAFSGFSMAPMPDPSGPPPAPRPEPAAAPSPGGLIDSVPWRTGGTSSSAVQPPSPFNPPPAPAAPTSASIPTPAPGNADISGQAAGPADFDPDHDGETIMKSDLAGVSARPAPVREPGAAVGPLVLARVCERGHANPPTHAQCAVCRSPLPADAVQVARPRLGRMRVSTGELVDLDQSLVIGRQPSVSRVQGGGMPRLVQVASPSGDISRSHVEVRLEGWHVMLCDLKATNGTVLVREGQPPRRLAQNEMAILLDGDIAELGDDISLRFEEIL
ncbi:hypothetical protein DBR22_06910 [Arthrobacter sp. HMWF013]|nr:hypothetical protein DBR22_06910 [Arthrobacter sp. HMWF013]